MADPLGIIGVIGVITQIIQIGVQFGLDWKDAPHDAKSFVAELQALKTILSETNANILVNPEFRDAFHGRHSTLLSQLGDASSTDITVMVSACGTELESLLNDLKKRPRAHGINWERLKGAFLAKRTREAVENLHRQCQALNSIVAIDIAALTGTIHNEVKEGRKEQWEWHDAETRRQQDQGATEILNWLTSADYSLQQRDFISRRQEGTGQWLLESQKYRQWLETEKQTLFCPGIPGAGKTILTSIVVEDLTTRFGDDGSVGIAYIYCDFRRQGEQKAQDLLASLLKQLAQSRPSLPDNVKSLHDWHKDKRTRPSFDEISTILRSVAILYTRVFIIVDALDECQISGGCRAKLLQEMLNLQARCGINFFTTARPIPEIEENFNKSMSLEIRASPEDVRSYMNGHISDLPSFVARNPELQEEIKTEIITAVDGIYVFLYKQIFTILILLGFYLYNFILIP